MLGLTPDLPSETLRAAPQPVRSDCPKCGLHLPAPDRVCPKCGLIFAKFIPAARKPEEIIVTTGELQRPYDVIGPIMFQTTNRDRAMDAAAKQFGLKLDQDSLEGSWMLVAGANVPVAYKVLPTAFAVCVEGLKRACLKVGGDAVVWMRQDTDIEPAGMTGSMQVFYMQVYGTAVKFR